MIGNIQLYPTPQTWVSANRATAVKRIRGRAAVALVSADYEETVIPSSGSGDDPGRAAVALVSADYRESQFTSTWTDGEPGRAAVALVSAEYLATVIPVEPDPEPGTAELELAAVNYENIIFPATLEPNETGNATITLFSATYEP